MTKRLHDYVKYTADELEAYVQSKSACVHKVNTDLHMAFAPYALADFKSALKAQIFRKKVGYYDARLKGIVLDVKNIKLVGSVGALRADDFHIHANINADCYVFRPVLGAILHGTVKHIGVNGNIGVVIYRVFNANVRLKSKECKSLGMDDVIKFRLISFNIENVFPYIEGELLTSTSNATVKYNGNLQDKKHVVKMEPEVTEMEGDTKKLCKNIIIKQEIMEVGTTSEQYTPIPRKKRKKN